MCRADGGRSDRWQPGDHFDRWRTVDLMPVPCVSSELDDDFTAEPAAQDVVAVPPRRAIHHNLLWCVEGMGHVLHHCSYDRVNAFEEGIVRNPVTSRDVAATRALGSATHRFRAPQPYRG